MTVRDTSRLLVVVCWMLSGCVSAQQQKKSDSADWRKVADLFMADLVANRIDKAVERFEPEFKEKFVRSYWDRAMNEASSDYE